MILSIHRYYLSVHRQFFYRWTGIGAFDPFGTIIIGAIECISFVGNIFLEFKRKIFLLQNMRKMMNPFFHDASILVSVGVFLTHRFETVGVFAHFLWVKNALYLELC